MTGVCLRTALAAVLVWGGSHAMAEGVGTEAQERARITTERAAAQSAFGSRERDCQNSFVVTPCVENARRDLREVMLRLRRQEAVLDEMQRRERAAQRMEMIRNRPAATEPVASAAASPPPVATKAGAPRVRVHEPRTPKVSAAERQQAEVLAEQKFEAASQAASARRAAVEGRNAERAASGKAVAPLPVPSGASAP
jgi:colicin import membrane protein